MLYTVWIIGQFNVIEELSLHLANNLYQRRQSRILYIKILLVKKTCTESKGIHSNGVKQN